VKINGECFSKQGKMALSSSLFSLSSGMGLKYACGEIGHGMITWDFQICSYASLTSGSSINWGLPVGIVFEKFMGSLLLGS